MKPYVRILTDLRLELETVGVLLRHTQPPECREIYEAASKLDHLVRKELKRCEQHRLQTVPCGPEVDTLENLDGGP